jgi:hypothetical protein
MGYQPAGEAQLAGMGQLPDTGPGQHLHQQAVVEQKGLLPCVTMEAMSAGPFLRSGPLHVHCFWICYFDAMKMAYLAYIL